MEETARKNIKNLLNDWPVRDAAHFSKVDDYEKTSKKHSTQCPVYVDCGEHAINLTYAEYCRFKRF